MPYNTAIQNTGTQNRGTQFTTKRLAYPGGELEQGHRGGEGKMYDPLPEALPARCTSVSGAYSFDVQGTDAVEHRVAFPIDRETGVYLGGALERRDEGYMDEPLGVGAI